MLTVPYWLTGRGIDQIKDEYLDEFDKVRKEFMYIFEEEEQKMAGKEHDILLARVMCDMWESKGVWFWHCIKSVNAMYFLLEDHLCPRFSGSLSLKAEEIVSQFWCEHSEDIVARKLAEKERYDQELRRLFDGKAAEITYDDLVLVSRGHYFPLSVWPLSFSFSSSFFFFLS